MEVKVFASDSLDEFTELNDFSDEYPSITVSITKEAYELRKADYDSVNGLLFKLNVIAE